MAGIATAAANNGLTAAQLQALRSAAQQAVDQTGGTSTTSAFDQNEYSDLVSSGAFSPEELQALQSNGLFDSSGGAYQNEKGGNTSGILAASVQEGQDALSDASQSGGPANIVNQTLDPAQIASTQPLPYSSFGTTPVLGASTYSSTGYAPALVDPSQSAGYLAQSEAMLQPEFDKQSQALDQSLAARGILNSGAAVQAQNDLAGTQTAQLVPLVSQGYGYAQQDLTGNQTAENTALGFNASGANTAASTNAASTNAINEFNANNYLGTTTGDQSAYNTYLAGLEQSGLSYGTGLVGGYLGTYAPASSTQLSTAAQGANTATTAGLDAGNASLASSGALTNDLGDAASKIKIGGTKAAASGPTDLS